MPAYAPQRALHTVQKLLMDGSDLSPTLPDGWDTVRHYAKCLICVNTVALLVIVAT